MLLIVLATARPEALSSFAAALSSDPEVHLQQVASGTEALEAGRTLAPHLMVIDYLPDTESLSLVRKLLTVNAMVNTAVVSPLADEEFHEASEGLGILGRLPSEPGISEAADLLQKLRQVLGRTG
ncbi:MAG: response regulator [Deltaproteobacteria bacterium]|nr:response regulator [Deltaproteobacteria bacterium]